MLGCLAGKGLVEIPKQWRLKAADCLRLSREANTPESQSHWASMAEFWLKMAKQVEDREINDSGDPTIINLPFNGKEEST
jgi:hypothetical protein